MSKVNYRPHKKNLRLDLTLYNLGFTESRAKAIDLIKRGKVFVNSKIVKKNSYLVNKEDKIYLKKDVKQWVSRGAIKLLYALEKFDLDVWYVDNQSIWLDIKILWITVKKVIMRDGINQAEHSTMENFKGNDNEK